MPARRDCAGDDTLAFLVASDRRPQLLNDSDRLMPDRKATGDGVFAFQDVDIGTADSRRGNADESIRCAHIR